MVEHLPSKHTTLSLTPRTKKKKTTNQRINLTKEMKYHYKENYKGLGHGLSGRIPA
jgi:hypothetical protein